jgi:spore coat protein U-like protein
VVINCDFETAFTIDLGPGTGSFEQRTMIGGESALDYNLYTDASRMIVWGDGVSGANVSASGTNVSVPVYGRIPARQIVEARPYGDSVTITISY